jgi:hypothetical protein
MIYKWCIIIIVVIIISLLHGKKLRLYQYLKEAITLSWATADPFLCSKISLNCLNLLFMTMFRIMLNLIQISMASPELSRVTNLVKFHFATSGGRSVSIVRLGTKGRGVCFFSTSWLLLSAVSVELMLYILIFPMLSTLYFIICSCINWTPSDYLMFMLAGFAAT